MPVHGGMSSGTDRTNWPELCSAMIEMSSWRVVYVKEDKVEKKTAPRNALKLVVSVPLTPLIVTVATL